MTVGSPLSREVLSEKRRAIATEWLVRTLRTYPENASRFLLLDKDPFRNPVGHSLKEGLRVVVEELFGGMDLARITPALDGILRIRAVQDFSAGEAVSFVFLLKKVVREELGSDPQRVAALEEGIDELAVLAFDLFMKCREKIYEIKANDAKRSLYAQLNRDRKRAVP